LHSNVYVIALVFRKKALQILDVAIEQGVEIAISDKVAEDRNGFLAFGGKATIIPEPLERPVVHDPIVNARLIAVNEPPLTPTDSFLSCQA
jgi:hypothetical protein